MRLETTEDVKDKISSMYASDLSTGGVIHVTAVWKNPENKLVTIKINEHSPKSEHDFFALNLARARADAIITSGKILREEESLTHNIQGPHAEALKRWRREHLQKSEHPYTLVITSGRDIDIEHPIFHSSTRPIIYVPNSAPTDLEDKVRGTKIEVVRVEKPSIRGAIDYIKERGAKTISIEAGPSTSKQLYEAPAVIDELMLSIYSATSLDDRAVGEVFLSETELKKLLKQSNNPYKCEEESGPWEFYRLLKR